MITLNGTKELDTNSTILLDNPLFNLDFDPIYHGNLVGFDASVATRPLTLTQRGCEELCGSTAQLNGVMEAFQILTTWVLPVIALLSQLPYESSGARKSANVEALMNWVGAPGATLATAMHNILMIRRCSRSASEATDNRVSRYADDAYYVLSAINQYEFPGPSSNDANTWTTRNTALIQGALAPLLRRGAGDGHIPDKKWERLQHITSNLAFQLRMQRRKAVWPLAVSIAWFLIAFVISIVTALADLGDNTKAHSLALGLLLLWLPVVVVMAIIDRNPVAAERCQILIERWLFNVDAILEHTDPDTIPQLWRVGDTQSKFSIGPFVGQGRRLRYCGVASAVLDKIENPKVPHLLLSGLQSNPDFERALKKRPWSWWITWITGQLIVTIGYSMAFMVSFNTPTVGFGCRSLLYTIWYAFSSISWLILGFQQEPPLWLRRFSWLPNTLASFALLTIMILQVVGGLNDCTCKSSVFGTKTYGGYMDFENGSFYHRAYHVQRYWISAAVIGFFGCTLPIAWALRQWSKRSNLWKTSESKVPEEGYDMSSEWLM